jgi:hypothetical protein
VDVDHGQLVYPSLKDCPVFMDLHERPQSIGGPRAGESGGGSSGSPRCVRIFRIGPGSVMNAISRMSPPLVGHASGNSSPTRAISFAHAIREVSCERGF